MNLDSLAFNELGTIAVFREDANMSFAGKSDNEVKALAGSPNLLRFAHHYSPEELTDIFKPQGLKPNSYSIEIGKTPSGNLNKQIL